MFTEPTWIRAKRLDTRGIPAAGAGRTLLLAKICRPWTPPIARLCISPQGASGVVLVKYPG
jgi:hypothetical protein